MISKEEVYNKLRKVIKCKNNKENYTQLLYFEEQDVINIINSIYEELENKVELKNWKPKVGEWVFSPSSFGDDCAFLMKWTKYLEEIKANETIKYEPFNGNLPTWLKKYDTNNNNK